MALDVVWLFDTVLESDQGVIARRNWLAGAEGEVSNSEPFFEPAPLWVPPNWSDGGLAPPSSRGSAVDEALPGPAVALVWLMARMVASFRAYASADPPGAGVVWVDVVPLVLAGLVDVEDVLVDVEDVLVDVEEVDVLGDVVFVEVVGAAGADGAEALDVDVWVLVVPVDASAATGIAKSTAAPATAPHRAIRIQASSQS